MYGYKFIGSVLAFLFTFTLSLLMTTAADAQAWKQYSDPGKAGWSREGLEKARAFAREIGSGAVLVVDHGNVVAAWGNIDFPYKAASMRKSIYDGTFGAVFTEKRFDTGTTLKNLGIDDLGGLTDKEKTATFEQLMEARSGVYHAAAYETRGNAELRPKRGSADPGTFWYYNNWDFNVVCPAFEKLTGRDFRTSFEEKIAKPLGMEDFRDEYIFNWLEPRSSEYPAVTIRLSARDLARFGQMYLNGGTWGGKRIVDAAWIKRSTTAHTVFEKGHYRGEGNGYGRLWWVYPARPSSGSALEAHQRIAARGAGGQMVFLIPDLDIVIVHLANTDTAEGVPDRSAEKLLDLILQARGKGPSGGEALKEVSAEEIGSPPPVLDLDLRPIAKEKIDKLAGKYMVSDKIGIRLYEHDDRLFAEPVGMGLPDVEVLSGKDGALSSPLVDVVFKPQKDADGSYAGLSMTFRGRTMIGRRTDRE